jgi:hypothetical protein
MFDLADAILIVGGDRLNGREDLFRRLWLRFQLLRDNHRLRFLDGRDRKLRTRVLRLAENLRRGLRLPQPAATTAPAGTRAHQKHKMRFLMHWLFEWCSLDAVHREEDQQQCHRTVPNQ